MVMKRVVTGGFVRQVCNSLRMLHLWLPPRTIHGSYLRGLLQMAVWGNDLHMAASYWRSLAESCSTSGEAQTDLLQDLHRQCASRTH